MLSKKKVLQMIKKGKRKLGINDIEFKIQYSAEPSNMEKRAEIVIHSESYAEIVLYPRATFFSVRHELCHAKLFRMGVPLTNTKKDLELFPDREDYMRMVVIVEWYINELQKRVFGEYYAIDEAGTPRQPPFSNLPELPEDRFTEEQVEYLIKIAEANKD